MNSQYDLMNPRVKNLWLDELESGKYSQGTGYLRKIVDGTTYHCCLGILVDIYARETGQSWDQPINVDDPDTTATPFHDEYHILPKSVMDWAGLKDTNPDINVFDGPHSIGSSLGEMNDLGRTFDEIADAIREQL
jgi:hypothetical protein